MRKRPEKNSSTPWGTSELLWGQSCVAVKIGAKVGLVGKVELVCHLFDAQTIVAKKEFGLLDGLFFDDFIGCLA